MIKNVFIPEKIGTHYLFQKRIVGFDVGKTHINATQILVKGKAITVEKCIETPLEPGNVANYDERAIAALKITLEQLDPYDQITTSLSSSLAIFKELKLPFLDTDKIRLIIEFEVEPLLPFSVSDAVVDFIVTKQLIEEKSSEIIVAAVQKQHIAHHISLFAQAGVNPDVITIDLFALYGVYRLIPAYAHLSGSTVLIDLGAYTTSIAYIQNGQLRLIRSIAKGVLTQAKAVSQALDIQPNEAMENIIRFGLEKSTSPSYVQTVSEVFSGFWQEIAFTLNSFSTQAGEPNPIHHILLLGGGAAIKGLPELVTKQLGIPCEPFQIHKLLHNPALGFTSKNGVPNSSIMSLCTALPTSTTADFNLLRKEFEPTTDRSLFTKQLITAVSLMALIIVSLAAYDFFQLRSLNNAAQTAEQEVIDELKRTFKGIPADADNLDSVVQQAQAEVQREQKLWFAFANPDRVSFLQYLLELTSIINKEKLGFTIDRLIITDNQITMTARVKDYEALGELEDALGASKILKRFEKQDSPNFTMKIRIA